MITTLNKIASVLFSIIGILSIFAGALAMTGRKLAYFILNCLPIYNFILDALTVLIPPSSSGKTVKMQCPPPSQPLTFMPL